MNFKPNMLFLNCSFDKKRLKALLLWFRLNLSESAALKAVEILQGLGFHSATQGAISLGLDDLKTPTSKGGRVFQAQVEVALAHHEHHRGNRTPVELFQHLVDTWHRTSQDLTTEVVQLFHSTERVNPVYMMAFSGARGNISQVRQLVGMRGLMADPRGQIVGFPILSNFREGLTITEYFVSCYGARKGVVDTAIRTADAGYLTRRLADVSHHVVVRTTNCGTHGNILLRDIKEGQKTILSLANRLVGRVLAEHLFLPTSPVSDSINHVDNPLRFTLQSFKGESRRFVRSSTQSSWSQGNQRKASPVPNTCLASLAEGLRGRTETENHRTKPVLTHRWRGKALLPNFPIDFAEDKTKTIIYRNSEITSSLASKLTAHYSEVPVRSPLSCSLPWGVCQLCYGWGLSEGRRVTLGEAVGIIAAQSIGEPGTQLTLRTFHTGGVFSGELLNEIRAPYNGNVIFPTPLQGLLLRTPHGQIAFLTKVSGKMKISETEMHFASQRENLDKSTLLKNSKSDPQPATCSVATVSGDTYSRASYETSELKYRPLAKLNSDATLRERRVDSEGVMRVKKQIKDLQCQRRKPFTPTGSALLPKDSWQIEDVMPCVAGKGLASLAQQSNQDVQSNSGVVPCFQRTAGKSKMLCLASLAEGLSKQDSEFLIQPSTVIFVKQKEHVINNQLLAEFSSSTLQSANDQIEITQQVLSETAGQIWFKEIEYGNRKGPGSGSLGTSFSSQKLGGIWVLAGKPMIDTYPSFSRSLLSCRALHETPCLAEQHVSLPKERSFTLSTKLIESKDNAAIPLIAPNQLLVQSNPKEQQSYNICSALLPKDSWQRASLEEVLIHYGKDYVHKFVGAPYFSNTKGINSLTYDSSDFVDNKYKVLQGKTFRTKLYHSPSKAKGLLTSEEVPYASLRVGSEVTEPSLFNTYGNKSLKSFIPLVTIIRGKQKLQKIPSINIFDKTTKTKMSFSVVFNKFFLSNIKKLLKFPKINESFLKRKNLFNFHTYGIQNRLKRSRNTRYAKTSTISLINLQNNYGVLKYNYVLGYSQATSSKKHINQVDNICFFTPASEARQDTSRLVKLKNKRVTSKMLRAALLKPRSINFGNKELNSEKKIVNHLVMKNHLSLSKKRVSIPSTTKLCQGTQFSLVKRRMAGTPIYTFQSGSPNALYFEDFYDLATVQNRQKSYLSINYVDKAFDKSLSCYTKLRNSSSLLSLATSSETYSAKLKRVEGAKLYVQSKEGLAQLMKVTKQVEDSQCQANSFPRKVKEKTRELNKKNKKLNRLPLLSEIDLVTFVTNYKENLNNNGHKRNSVQGIQPLVLFHPVSASQAFLASCARHGKGVEVKDFVLKNSLENIIPLPPIPVLPPLAPYFNKTSFSFSAFLSSFNASSNTFPLRFAKGGACLAQQIYNIFDVRYVQSSEAVRARQRRACAADEVHLVASEARDGEADVRACQVARLNTDSPISFPNPFNFSSSDSSAHYPEGVKRRDSVRVKDVQKGVALELRTKRRSWPCFARGEINVCITDNNKSYLSTMLISPMNCFVSQGNKSSYFVTEKRRLQGAWIQKKRAYLTYLNQIVKRCSVPFTQQFTKGITSSMLEALSLPTQYSPGSRASHETSCFASYANPLPATQGSPSVAPMLHYPLRSVASEQDVSLRIGKEGYTSEAFTHLISRTNLQLSMFCVPLTSKVFEGYRFTTLAASASETFCCARDASPQPATQGKPFTCKTTEGLRSKEVAQQIPTRTKYSFATQSSSRKGFTNTRGQESVVRGVPCFAGWRNNGNEFRLFPGQLIAYGDNIAPNIVTTESGQVLYIDSDKITVRKAQTVLIYSQAIIAVLSGDWIRKGTPLMSLSYQKLVTGDIVQGLPKIEQFFEAPVLRDGTFWSESLQAKLNQFFQEEREKLPLAEAVRKGFSEIQRVLVEGVLRVYISQGVLIADKHLEVIVRQMTCKGRILYSGDTGFLRNELVSLDKIENVNQVTYGQKALYHPQVRGITDASLESESFLSAASFQETTRVLSRDAIIGKTDLMRGLKERVIVGELIQAGTGLANNSVYNLLAHSVA